MTDIDLNDLRRLVSDPRALNGETFPVLRRLSALTNSQDPDLNSAGRELVIRLLEHRDEIDEQYQELLSALLRAHGLFPYISPLDLRGEADLLAYEAYRPAGLDQDDIVFHRVQGAIYFRLLEGENVILSAPTSFGKSLIIDALLSSGRYSNVVIVVPTLALIDETRRRLAERFSGKYKIITHPTQRVATRNVFIYTQERAVEHESFPDIDLFVIDEFYKLNSPDEQRAGLLNQALYRLLKTGAQFYFLGPNVQEIAADLPRQFNATFFQTDFSTVAIDVADAPRSGDDMESLVALCASLDEPTLIYCRSPKQTRDVAAALVASGVTIPSSAMTPAAQWVAQNYDPDWLAGKALGLGIGIHNGRIPRSLAQFMVRAFNAGDIRFLVCTSTLIEGVNTAAKNVIIFDNKIAASKFDFFTFNNIRGRSGRMFRHFVGRVFLFYPPPQTELPFVDVPVLSQPDSAPTSLLVQIDDEDLKPSAHDRIDPILRQTDLSVQTIRQNSGVAPELQVEVARRILDELPSLHPLLSWRGIPRWEQLLATCELVWQLGDFGRFVAGVSSGRQLAFKLSRLSRNPLASEYIPALAQGDRRSLDGDEKVESALEFVRQWASHHAPRLFGSLDRIQKEVFRRAGMSPGDYVFYISRLQNQFLPSAVAALDEYGLPVEVGIEIRRHLNDQDLDSLLESVRRLKVDALDVTGFEKALVLDTQRSLGESPPE